MNFKDPRPAILIVFPSGEARRPFPWRRLAQRLGAPVEVLVAADWALAPQACLERLMERTGEVRRLACAGAGEGALAAMAFGQFLGAHAIGALAPGAAAWPDDGGLDVQTLVARFHDDAFAVPGQSLALLTSNDSLDRDLALARRLQAAPVEVSLRHAGAPLAALPLAVLQCGWAADWLDALVNGEPPPAGDLADAWRMAFRHEIEIDFEATRLEAGGALSLVGRLWNRTDEAMILGDRVLRDVTLGAEILQGAGTEPLAATRTPLPVETLAPGQAATVLISMDGAALNRPDGTLRLGLVYEKHLWLEDAGFPALRLKAGGSDTPSQDAAPKPFKAPVAPAPSPRGVSRSDVIACYRVFLGREPESEAAVEGHIGRSEDLWTLIRQVLDSRESARWRWHEAVTHLDRERNVQAPVEVEVSDEEARRLIEQVEDNWRRQGEAEPYFSAFANPDYLAERLTAARREDFYATGVQEVALLAETCRIHGVDLRQLGSVLEFGCRVGRLAEPLAHAIGAYTGLDVSPTQLDIAADRLQARGVEDARVLTVAEGLAEDRAYGLLFSVLVFQHFPPPVIYRWLDKALARVRPGGFAFFQLPCLLYDYRFVAKDHLLGRGRQGPLALHALPQARVFALLHQRGFAPIEVIPSPRIGAAGLSYTFFAQRLAATAKGRGPASARSPRRRAETVSTGTS